MRRGLTVLLALTTSVGALGVGTLGVAHAAPEKNVRTYDKNMLRYVNQAREADGLKPYKESARLYRMAHAWAEHIIETRNLEHNPATTTTKSFRAASGCTKATIAGENIGDQSSTNAKQLFALYMSDPAHRDNNLSPKYNAPGLPGYTDVGIATVAVPNGDGTSSEIDVMDFANNCS
jgi:uncharacterized protein YkwD